mgnify:CR=1 FL=1
MIMRFCLFGAVGLIGALVLGGGESLASAEPTGKWSFTYSFTARIGIGGRCVLVRDDYRGPIDGGGPGFENEIDLDASGQEMLSAIDIAHQLMRGEMSVSGVGQYSSESIRDSVINAYEAHLSDYPDDWYTMRELAVALLWDQRYEAGLMMLARSYVGDPALVRVALDAELFGVGSNQMQKLTQRMVRYAKANDSGQAWFVVAMIMQSKGDLAHARTNLERALGAGFDAELGAAMGDALSKK